MEKTWRLQRYNQKNYSEVVEFPVEIIGRDGVVKRYTFEDSIRLYRRRITFAPIRYRDDHDLVHAEVDHCRSRIDQLRRSYFFRHGWQMPEGEASPVELFGSLAGELAAFLCRVLRVDGRPEVRFELVQELGSGKSSFLQAASKPISAWYLVPKDSPAGMLLYVHRFDGADPEDVREDFFARVKEFERAGAVAGDGERLLAFHHTLDCGFVLTTRGADFEALDIDVDDSDEFAEPTAWDDALDALRKGNATEGLGRCRQIVTEQPWHRQAYIAGAGAALHLEQPAVAEDFALIGSKYFPNESMLSWYLAVARARQGRMDEARADLERAVASSPTHHAARLSLALQHVAARNWRRGWALVAAAPKERGDDKRAHNSVIELKQWLLCRRVLVGTGYTAAALGLLATALAGWFGLLPVALGLGLASFGVFLAGRKIGEIREGDPMFRRGPSHDDLAHVVRRLRRIGIDD